MSGGARTWRGRSTPARTRNAAAGVVLAVAVAMVLPLSAVALPQTAAATAATAQPSAEPDAGTSTERFYVVGPGVNGQKEYLYQIAVRTLGDGNRFREIFELNRDRPQPDGGRLTDPLDLRPGWILLLPPDADGAGVQHGRPPQVATPPSAGPTGTPARDEAADDTGTGFTGYLLRLAAFGLMVLLLAVALTVLRGRRRTSVSVAARGSTPPEATDPGPEPVPDGSPAPGPAEDPGTATTPGGVVASGPVVDPNMVVESGSVVEAGPVAAERGGVGELRVALGHGPDRVEVHLAGARRERDLPAYGWLPDGERLPGATLPVVVGERDGRRLWLDLAGTPDVFTITGDPDACRRRALDIAAQLRSAGIDVTVVGRVLGGDLPAGCRHTDTFPAPAGAAARPGIVISGGLRGANLRAARGMAADTAGEVVSVLVGKVLRARWSLLVGTPVAEPDPEPEPASARGRGRPRQAPVQPVEPPGGRGAGSAEVTGTAAEAGAERV